MTETSVTSVIWLRVAAALYSLGLVDSVFLLTRQKEPFFRTALGAFWLGGLFHLVSIVELGLIQHQFPVTDIYQRLSLCAFLITVSFLFAYWKYRTASLSVFIFPLVFVLALIAALGNNDSVWSSVALKNSWLIAHIVFSLLGYAALLFTAIAAVLYLVQEQRLKKKKLRHCNRLSSASLGVLDDLISSSLSLGFVFITIGVIIVVVWASATHGMTWIRNPKVDISLITWSIYLVLIFLRTSAGWRGRKAAFLAIAALFFSVITWMTHGGIPSPVKLVVTGVNHKTAPVEVRERLAFPENSIPDALDRLRSGQGVSEVLILSTCNRVEITVATEDDADPQAALDSFLVEARGNQVYRYEGREAIHHLFRVAASLESMVVGEPQILGQMKAAYAISKSNGAMNGVLENVMSRALSRWRNACARRPASDRWLSR